MEIKPTLLCGDENFRIVRQVTDAGVAHDLLESRDVDDAMGQPRWRPMDGNKAIQAMKAYIIRQAEELRRARAKEPDRGTDQ